MSSCFVLYFALNKNFRPNLKDNALILVLGVDSLHGFIAGCGKKDQGMVIAQILAWSIAFRIK